MANYKDELIKKIEFHKQEAKRLGAWLNGLCEDGFDFDNVTDTQKWCIEKYLCASGEVEEPAQKST